MNAIRMLENKRGAALITALMLTTVSLVICLALLYIITQSTKSTASQKRYSNSLAASYGGAEMVKDIMPRLMSYSTARSGIATISGFTNVNLAFPSNTADLDCFTRKMKFSTSQWGSACTDENKSSNAGLKPDFTFKLNGLTSGNGFRVSAKIVNTIKGNSDISGVDYLEAGLGVSQAGGGVIAPQHFPSLFTVELRGEREVNAKERAEVSVLYAY
jgi:hypothetical protein